MTLPEAYQRLRREAISLRRENAKLKDGTYTDPEKAAHEEKIRKLNLENKNLVRMSRKYRDLWRHALDFPRGPSIDDLIRIEDLENENTVLREENTALKKQLQDALDTIAKLKAQMNRDHENSSIPSSKERFPKKIRNSRIKTGRVPGGQPGHHGHPRPHMEPTVPPVMIPVPQDILNNPDYYLTGKIIRKQVADIEFHVSVTEYQTPEYRSRSTGKRGHAPFPDGVVNEFNYGENTKALAFLLNNYCDVSIEKTAELISGLSDERITLSKGMVNSLSRQFSCRSAADRDRIYRRLLTAPAMYSDATPGRVNGRTVQVILCANEDEMLYFFREHKGFEGLKGTPVEEYQQTLVHDHDTTYYNFGAAHQECLAHVLRYLQDSIDNEPLLQWNKKMKAFLSNIIHRRKTEDLSEAEILEIESEYSSIIREGTAEYREHPPNRYYPDGLNLLKRLHEYRDSHLMFIRHPEIQPTNNLSERALRKFKRKQHQAVAFRSNQSVEYLCDCMSVIETNRLYNTNIYKTTRQVFSPV